jgi:two-component system, OmpR family, response regulator
LSTTSDENDLDFTQPSRQPLPTITPEEAASARSEAVTGTPELQKSGAYVAIRRRTRERIPPRSGSQYSLLVIEDDPVLIGLLKEILALASFEVRTASNRSEINKQVNSVAPPDLILLDIELPDTDGMQILGRLRGHPKYKTMPVIMMTGRASPSDVEAGLAAGADGYVTKPFRMSALVAAVHTVLGNRKEAAT